MHPHSFRELFAPGLVLVFLCCPSPARAAETSPIQCGANEDRVWVYDSLDSFDVSLKLKCGEPVEIIGRVKGYVKIRTSTGKEGYVPEKALPKPPETEENNQNSGPAQSSSQEGPQSIAAAARAKTSPSNAPGQGPKPVEHASTTVIQTKSTVGAPTPARDSNDTASSAPQTTDSPANTNSSTAAVRNASNPSDTVSVSSASAAAPTSAPAAPAKIELADNLPSEPATSIGSSHATASPRDPDEEEEPVMKPLENKEVCRIYFSAYGLSPNQYKWMTRNRSKSFPGICPAPAPAMVDFIVIFTHDADFYNGTMPTPVHTDKNGFSDFTPLTTVDTTVVSPSDADKNRREYVWVFHTKRGTFDPAKFSPKRQPLFSTTESNKLGTAAGGRSAEDALRFIEQHGVDR
jgi:Bacterial SH3 domain